MTAHTNLSGRSQVPDSPMSPPWHLALTLQVAGDVVAGAFATQPALTLEPKPISFTPGMRRFHPPRLL